ncbi:hypothetical protein JCM15519_01110 [Fundidesulfovibrio butyratiphilus]
MAFNWKKAFSRAPAAKASVTRGATSRPADLASLKAFLDLAHVKYALLGPYFETQDYPLVEPRELLPSFDVDLFEYKDLPGFSMVALERPLSYFQEVFQYDALHSPDESREEEEAGKIQEASLQTLVSRIPKFAQEQLRQELSGKDITNLGHYTTLLPTLLHMERAHVLALNSRGCFNLVGVYCSFPSDLDTELKRFGLRMGKFSVGDDDLYERNRLFVYQFLMELHGFPIVSERRTSAALFARRLHRLGERFLVRVLGQSDRTITSLFTCPEAKFFPKVEKIALVSVREHFKDAVKTLSEGGYFIDPERRVVILRVIYQQHKYDPDNVRQDRALSVARQEVIHPITGESLTGVNVIKDSYTMFLRLNDIVRGEYHGRIVYKRHEIVEGSDTDEKRLKFLHSWLSKHQRRIISYSEDFYANVVKVLDNYLLSPDNYEKFAALRSLHQEVWAKYSYIQQARKVKILEDLQRRTFRGRKLNHLETLSTFTEILSDLKFEMVNYFDELVEKVLTIGERVLSDSYLRKKFVTQKDEELSAYGQSIKKNYGRLVSLLDEFRSIRKCRTDCPKPAAVLTL